MSYFTVRGLTLFDVGLDVGLKYQEDVQNAYRESQSATSPLP